MAVPLAGGGCREWRRCSLMEEAGEGGTACWWMRQGRAEELGLRSTEAMAGRSSGRGRRRPWRRGAQAKGRWRPWWGGAPADVVIGHGGEELWQKVGGGHG